MRATPSILFSLRERGEEAEKGCGANARNSTTANSLSAEKAENVGFRSPILRHYALCEQSLRLPPGLKVPNAALQDVKAAQVAVAGMIWRPIGHRNAAISRAIAAMMTGRFLPAALSRR